MPPGTPTAQRSLRVRVAVGILGLAALTGPAGVAPTASTPAVVPSAATATPPTAPGTPSMSPSPTVTGVDAAPLAFAQDTLVDPVVTGRVTGTGGVLVEAQRWHDGAWATASATMAAADGAYTLTLTEGHGELRTDRWRIVAGVAASADITVQRTAVLNPVVHAPTRAEVQDSWREGCPVSYTHLRVLDVNYYGFDTLMHRGSIVVRDTAVAPFEGLLQKAIEVRFPIRRMQPVDAYRAVDEDSAADDNTSAFNCRMTTLGSRWSEHAYGVAIDLNPVENPYLNGGVMVPTNGASYLDRSDARAGMLTPGSPLIVYARANGWTWLAPTDYQHLER